MIQARTLAGMMELLPEDQLAFNKMKDTIEEIFKNHGFFPLDTPAMESMDVLLAKGGGETAQQVYTIDTEKKDRGLRFDLTVPLAKYVSLYFSDLEFPFRRYHIDKVYRGERNQRGRYREFYQCDVDIIGHPNLALFNDAEVIHTMYEIFVKLGLDFQFHYNNRKILNGYFNYIGLENFTSILRIIDDLPKIGKEKVKEKLSEEGLTDKQTEQIFQLLEIKGTNIEIINSLRELEVDNEMFLEGIHELEEVYSYLMTLGVDEKFIIVDLSITRGLDYYTGMVIETFLINHEDLGSICSGGRYDDLAGNFTKQNLPGVGLSIGLTRLFYILQEEKLIELEVDPVLEVMIIPMKGAKEESVKILSRLREEGHRGMINMESGRMGKKFGYADKLEIPYVIIIGEDEIKAQKYSFRNMESGDQELLSIEEILDKL